MERAITATHVYRYLLCEHSATLAFHGDPARRVNPHEGLRLMLELGNRHEADFVAEHCADWSTPRYPERDWGGGLEATLELMRKAVPGILQGVLLGPDRLGMPDLLRKEAGKSELGDHHYVAGDIKSSARPHTEQVMQVLFYTRLVEELQGRQPSYGYLVMADGREKRFQVETLLPIFDEVLMEIRGIRAGKRATRLHLCRECGSCQWRNHCRGQALAADDLSRIAGIGRGTAELLRQAGIATVAELAAMSAERAREVADADLLGLEVLEPLRRRGRATARGKPTILSAPDVPPPPEGLYVVAAGDPRRAGSAFLYDLLEVSGAGEERRQTLLADSPEQEGDLWRQFLARVKATMGERRHKHFAHPPIFHAGGLAPASLESIQALHGGDREAFERVHDEGIDLSRVLLRSIAVPTPSANLRAYASFDGCGGESEGAPEADSGLGWEPEYGGAFGHYYPWYERLGATGEARWRDKILAAAGRELEALRSLRLRLHVAAERASEARARSRGRATGERRQ